MPLLIKLYKSKLRWSWNLLKKSSVLDKYKKKFLDPYWSRHKRNKIDRSHSYDVVTLIIYKNSWTSTYNYLKSSRIVFLRNCQGTHPYTLKKVDKARRIDTHIESKNLEVHLNFSMCLIFDSCFWVLTSYYVNIPYFCFNAPEI